jgi:hydrogenase maturation protease
LKKIKVVGIGNLIMQDEGVGVHAINQLAEMDLPPGVDLIDGGVNSYDLLDIFCEADKLVIIDAMQTGGEPGTIYQAPLEELGLKPAENVNSLHEMHFIEAVQMTNLLGYNPEVIVFGVEPKTIAVGMELTPEIARILPRLLELVKMEIERLVA